MKRLGHGTRVDILRGVTRIFSSAKRAATTISIPKRQFSSSAVPVVITLSLLLVGLTLSPSLRGTFTHGGSVTAFDENIATYESDYSTPKSSWNLGQTAFAKATGSPADRRIVWVAPNGAIAKETNYYSGTQSDSYAIPTGSNDFAQVGTWTVQTIDADSTANAFAEFVVRDPNNANA